MLSVAWQTPGGLMTALVPLKCLPQEVTTPIVIHAQLVPHAEVNAAFATRPTPKPRETAAFALMTAHVPLKFPPLVATTHNAAHEARVGILALASAAFAM